MIAVLTNYYNPSNRAVKLSNFEKFISNIGADVFIVEAAFGSESFTLSSSDCHLQLRCSDLIWQQYSLINVGIKKLPDIYDKVVWVDCDILFNDKNWIYNIDDMLDQFKIVQNYSSATLLDKGSLDVGETKIGVVKEAIKNSKKPTATNMSGNLDLSKCFATGFTWGIQREIIEKFGIYDYWITGSCDSAFVIGIWGDWKNDFIKTRLNRNMKDHYMEWAVPFNKYVNGSVSYTNHTIKHLWHGSRNYKKRWMCLKDFDPYKDIELSENGTLKWCSEKIDMHNCCANMCLNYDIEFLPYL